MSRGIDGVQVVLASFLVSGGKGNREGEPVSHQAPCYEQARKTTVAVEEGVDSHQIVEQEGSELNGVVSFGPSLLILFAHRVHAMSDDYAREELVFACRDAFSCDAEPKREALTVLNGTVHHQAVDFEDQSGSKTGPDMRLTETSDGGHKLEELEI